MSDSNKKEPSEIFTIQFDTVDDSSEIPGIAELLGSKVKSSGSATTKAAGVKFNKPTQATSVKTLKEFGTKLEINFVLKDDAYRYIQHGVLSHSTFFGLDELYQDMKVSLLFVQEFGTFGEFKSAEKNYLFDAFGITEQQYLQFVLNQANKVLTVYVSEKSMLARKNDVIAFTENKNQNLSASTLDLNAA